MQESCYGALMDGNNAGKVTSNPQFRVHMIQIHIYILKIKE